MNSQGIIKRSITVVKILYRKQPRFPMGVMIEACAKGSVPQELIEGMKWQPNLRALLDTPGVSRHPSVFSATLSWRKSARICRIGCVSAFKRVSPPRRTRGTWSRRSSSFRCREVPMDPYRCDEVREAVREEQERNLRLLRHGIDPQQFDMLLLALAKRYEGRSVHPRKNSRRSRLTVQGEGPTSVKGVQDRSVPDGRVVEVGYPAEMVRPQEEKSSSSRHEVGRQVALSADVPEGVQSPLRQFVDRVLQGERKTLV